MWPAKAANLLIIHILRVLIADAVQKQIVNIRTTDTTIFFSLVRSFFNRSI